MNLLKKYKNAKKSRENEEREACNNQILQLYNKVKEALNNNEDFVDLNYFLDVDTSISRKYFNIVYGLDGSYTAKLNKLGLIMLQRKVNKILKENKNEKN